MSLAMSVKNLIFRQFIEPETSTFTYLLADAESKEAVLIDHYLHSMHNSEALYPFPLPMPTHNE